MSSEAHNYFTKDNLDAYLKELAKEYRKRNGKNMPAEIILIGGAAILANYGFRDMTTDVDAIIHASSAMKDAINYVGDKFGLPNGWLNADFMKTASYSSKLDQHSVYYKTYSNVLIVRTVAAEYLIAMKLRSGRKYKNDLSDIIGIMAEHEKQATPITKQMISAAVCALYGAWDCIPQDSQEYINDVLNAKNYEEMYISVVDEERTNKATLVEFEQNYPNVANKDNAESIIKSLKANRADKT